MTSAGMATYKQFDYEILRRRCVELSEAGWQQFPIAQAFDRFDLNLKAEAVEALFEEPDFY